MARQVNLMESQWNRGLEVQAIPQKLELEFKDFDLLDLDPIDQAFDRAFQWYDSTKSQLSTFLKSLRGKLRKLKK